MDGTNKVTYLEEYKLKLRQKVAYLEEYKLKLRQKENEGKKEIESVKRKVKEEVDVALQKRKSGELIPLVRTFTFKVGVNKPSDFVKAIEFFKKLGVSDIRIYKKDGTEILKPKDAVGEKTFVFSGEASIALLDFLSSNGYCYKITKDGVLVIFGKKND